MQLTSLNKLLMQ